MGWSCLTGDRQSSYYMENSVGASARLGGRETFQRLLKESLKDLDINLSTWESLGQEPRA